MPGFHSVETGVALEKSQPTTLVRQDILPPQAARDRFREHSQSVCLEHPRAFFEIDLLHCLHPVPVRSMFLEECVEIPIGGAGSQEIDEARRVYDSIVRLCQTSKLAQGSDLSTARSRQRAEVCRPGPAACCSELTQTPSQKKSKRLARTSRL